MKFIALALFLGLAAVEIFIQKSAVVEHGGAIICTSDGKMMIKIGRVEGIDPNAIRNGLFYLCYPATMGFGYANPRWIWTSAR